MDKNRTFYLVIFVLFPSLLFSQISISQSDFTSLYSIGNSYVSFADTLTESIDIGQPGGGNNWDFTNLTPHEMFEIEYVDPSTTPYADSFATATIANYFNQSFELGDGSNGSSEAWAYFNSNDATILGNAGLNTFTDMSGTTVTETISRHYPPFVKYDFPINANKMWTAKDSSETIVFSSGIPVSVTVTTTTYDVHIDAWGTMTMPSGKVVEALRSREITVTNTFIAGFPLGSSTSAHYFFLGKNGESLSVLADDENPANSGVITGSSDWSGDDVTSVEKLEALPTEFSLKQNYPNPFNPSTKIEYSITEPSFVNLTVYDVLGNQVAELVNEPQSAGNYRFNLDGSNLSSGTYFIQLRSGDLHHVRKMTLMK